MNLKDMIIESIESNDFELATEHLEDYHQVYGMDDFYYLAQTDILLGTEAYHEVIQTIHDAFEDGYIYSIFYERLAEAFIGLEMWDIALECLKNTPEEDEDGELHRLFLMGKIYLGKQDFKKAVSYFEDILLETEDIQIYFLAACTYWNLNKKKRAFEYFEKIKTNQEILVQIGLFLNDVGDPKAIEYIKEFQDAEFRTWLQVEYSFHHKTKRETLELLDTVMPLYPSVRFYNQIIILFEELGDEYRADGVRKKLIRLSLHQESDYIESMVVQIHRLIELGYTEATNRKHVNRILSDAPDLVEAVIEASYLLESFDQLDLTYYILNKLLEVRIEEKKNRVRYYTLRAHICCLSERFDEAYYFYQYIKPSIDSPHKYEYIITCFYTYHYDEVLDYTRDYKENGAMAGIRLATLNLLEYPDEVERLIKTMDQEMEKNKLIPDIEVYEDVKNNL